MARQIEDIIAFLEDCEGPDAQADQDIARALGSTVLNYTSSVDANLDLAREYLPGWCIDQAGDNASGTVGKLRVFGHTVEFSDGCERVQGDAPTRPLAYVLAVLKGIRIDRVRRVAALVTLIREASAVGVEFQVESRLRREIPEEVEEVISLIAAPFEEPEIEIDKDGSGVALRWLSGNTGCFSLTFLGDGNVEGCLNHPDRTWPVWSVLCSDSAALRSYLDEGIVRDILCDRLGGRN